MGDKSLLFSWLAPYSWNTTMKVLESKKMPLKKMITHQFTLKELEKGIQFMHSQATEKIKGMILV
jgi:threonine dehydrogenase-like Zn-dependent dehydrogenase